MNIQSGETSAIANGEKVYSEIASTSWSSAGTGTTDDVKSKSTPSQLKSPREPMKGASLSGPLGVGREKTSVPPEEALYDQPV